ncbi:hypothetical protein L484_002850 [Morus notabilis]|uniref:Uncharacterized protein n=1 Tax=Morus notabilis TaxID=981085 RepID=W9RXH9_9ROSA|nr:hypothetical protein L484_002850 [Morus notabilis]
MLILRFYLLALFLCTASVGYPFGTLAYSSHGKSGALPQYIEFSVSSFPLHLEILRSNSASITTSKGLISRICSAPDADDFFPEKVSTPILDLVESPINLKNLSSKVSHLRPLKTSVLACFTLKSLHLLDSLQVGLCRNWNNWPMKFVPS